MGAPGERGDGTSFADVSSAAGSAEQDGRLVERAQRGERDALDELLRANYDRIATLCRRLLVSPTDAEDATQEALIAVVRGLPGFDGRSAFTTWTYRVTTNVCLDELRRRARRPEPVDPDHRTARDVLTAEQAAFDDGVADRHDIDRALGRLAPEFRIPVVLRDLCGLDYAEISALTGAPPGTVRSRIARGRTALRASLTDRPDDGAGRGSGNRTASADVQSFEERDT